MSRLLFYTGLFIVVLADNTFLRNDSKAEDPKPIKFTSGVVNTREMRFGASANVSKSKRAYQLNEEGVELVFNGNRAQGRKKITQALDLDANNTTALYNLAGIELADANSEKAILLMQKAITLSPKDPAFITRLAEAHFANNDVNQAITNYEKVAAIDSTYGDVFFRLGSLYGMTQQWDKAEENLRKAIEIQPDEKAVLSNLGNVLVLRKKHEEAIKILERAQSLKKTAENSVALGIANESLGRSEIALTHYEEAKLAGSVDANLEKHIAELKTDVEKAKTAGK